MGMGLGFLSGFLGLGLGFRMPKILLLVQFPLGNDRLSLDYIWGGYSSPKRLKVAYDTTTSLKPEAFGELVFVRNKRKLHRRLKCHAVAAGAVGDSLLSFNSVYHATTKPSININHNSRIPKP